MAMRLNPKWLGAAVDELDKTGKLSRTTECNAGIQSIILLLNRRNIPFKLYNLGAGVKRVTTDTDTCPCCKRKLEQEKVNGKT